MAGVSAIEQCPPRGILLMQFHPCFPAIWGISVQILIISTMNFCGRSGISYKSFAIICRMLNMMLLSLLGYVWKSHSLPIIRWGCCKNRFSSFRGGRFGGHPAVIFKKIFMFPCNLRHCVLLFRSFFKSLFPMKYKLKCCEFKGKQASKIELTSLCYRSYSVLHVRDQKNEWSVFEE